MSIFFIVIYVILGIYVVLNFKYDLQMFQQNSYRLPRYWRWLRSDVGSTWRLVDVASLFLVMAVLLDYRLSALGADHAPSSDWHAAWAPSNSGDTTPGSQW